MSQTTASAVAAPESYDIANDKSVEKLHKNAIGLVGVLFLTVTGAAPMSAMLGNVPFGAYAGNGQYMPAAFLLATIVLTIFSVGYAAMASRVSSVGGFYSFISQGLGRDAGMAAGITSLFSYSVFEASLYGLFAFFANTLLMTYTGMNIPWIYLALFCVVMAGIFSYFDVQISAAVLGLALILEVVMLTIFNVGVMTAASGTNFDLESLNIMNVLTSVDAKKVGDVEIAAGAAAVGVFMAFWSWVGFEMAPNYAEESRDPKHIIPKSLYLSVIGLGLFYIWTSWCAVSAYPTPDDMVAKATKDAGNFFLTPVGTFVGPWAATLMNVLILTSSFACGMAFHNTAARYLYSLGREGALPSFLGNTHDTYKSPHVASSVQSVLAATWLGGFAMFMGTDDPNAQAYVGVYTMLAVLGTMLLLILQAIVSIAIIVYFAKHGGGSFLTTVLAPAVAFVAQAVLVYLLIDNLPTLGGTSWFVTNIPLMALGIIVLGFVWGLALRVLSPDAHARIGRLVYNA